MSVFPKKSEFSSFYTIRKKFCLSNAKVNEKFVFSNTSEIKKVFFENFAYFCTFIF